MVEMKELSAFQRNMNSLTLYLYLMNTKCKHLEDYDDEGEFETHNYFFNLCRTKLKDKIEGDTNLLINQPLFMNFKKKDEEKKGDEIQKTKQSLFYRIILKVQKMLHNSKPKEEEQNFLYKTYFEYSKTLSKSKLRNKAYNLIGWSSVVLIFFAIVTVSFIFPQIGSFSKEGVSVFLRNLEWNAIIFCSFMISISFFINGVILKSVINKKDITKRKFKYMYSDDYCYKRIKEAEVFFRTNYNVENDCLEISEVERQFPEEDNFFYKTIMETKMTESNKSKLLTYNANVYCRAVFSELFKLVKDEGIQIGNLQQIPFVFKDCQNQTKLLGGNTGFSQCVNHLLGKSGYTDTTFNQAKQKHVDPRNEISPMYLKILKKYENILG